MGLKYISKKETVVVTFTSLQHIHGIQDIRIEDNKVQLYLLSFFFLNQVMNADLLMADYAFPPPSPKKPPSLEQKVM